MKNGWLRTLYLVLAGVMLLSALPACRPAAAADSYMAVVPRVMHSGQTEAVSLALFSGGEMVRDSVKVSLVSNGREVASARETVNGKGMVALDIPDVDAGEYEVRVTGTGFTDKTTVTVARSLLVLLETDKPIYKPGQTINIRVLTLDQELKPRAETVTVDIMDAKGIKVFRRVIETDEYGMKSLELPLSDEPNLGVWKINAATEKEQSQLDVRVEEYVLPKYEVSVELPKEWFLVSEVIKGKVAAEYSFGRPVTGELKIVASRYVGQWEEYATFTRTIDGEIDFELPAAQYVAGVPAAGGQGNVALDITVTETATGYTEMTSRLLTVAQSSVNVQLIPEGSVFKPGLPFKVMVITETPDNQPVDASVTATVTYVNSELEDIDTVQEEIETSQGKAVLELAPPEKGVAMTIEASAGGAYTSVVLRASYSPSGNFIHLEQVSAGTARVGQKLVFKVNSTREAANFYYEVISRGMVVFSDYTRSREITFSATPIMAPTSRLLVYQILPNSEVAADYLPFTVEASYPQSVAVEFSQSEVEPASEVELNIQTEGSAKVGLAAVDRSVFILAENRLNLQQVFDELERLYMEPQAELHEVSFYPSFTSQGAVDIFRDAGVVVLTNNVVPEGKEYEVQHEGGGIINRLLGIFGFAEDAVGGRMLPPMVAAPEAQAVKETNSGAELAEVQRVRQFFPETWFWEELVTDAGGRAIKEVTVPDSITTWMLRAVAISKEKGLGVAEDSLTVFQPFFLSIDLPYEAIRGEEFPVSIAVYNYLDEAQSVQLDIEGGDWFDLLDDAVTTIEVAPNNVGAAQFRIRPKTLGVQEVKVTARSRQAADAVIKTIIIEPEGVAREVVDNLALSAGVTETIDTSLPLLTVADSGRAYVAITSSFLTQTIDGLEGLLQMPFGCGEQNMIVFAPDLYITKYLRDSGQLKAEIMAKAEKLMITGYQRELTYRRSDGSFSAFGMSDQEGSLWLTAFVLKCFAQATDVIYIDETVLNEARAWLTAHQESDGSFEPVGFVHHQDMLGGLKGKDALTAFTAIALMEAGETTSSGRAVSYLEGRLGGMDDAYTLAITSYALELAGSSRSGEAYDKLMAMAREDENGLHWGSDGILEPKVQGEAEPGIGFLPPNINRSADIEITAYATLALVKHGDGLNASRAAKWLVSKRNAYGGYGSTQDTVVALQALVEYAAEGRADVDLRVTLKGDGVDEQLEIDRDNFDVLQVVSVPVNAQFELTVVGKGDAVGQVVRRFNLPAAEEPAGEILKIDVSYDTTEVAVNDQVKVSVAVAFDPPEPMEAGMVVLDISVPTGFAPVTESIAEVAEALVNIKRFDVAGRKVIFYIENMKPGDRIAFVFMVRALYPVKAKGVASQAYAYYNPELKGESLGAAMTVR